MVFAWIRLQRILRLQPFTGDAEKAKAVYAGIDAIQPEDVADVVLYVTNQPKRLQISDVTIMANQQAAGFMVHKK